MAINPKAWAKERKNDDYVPAWIQLVGAKLWKDEQHSDLRSRLKQSMTKALAVGAGPGLACSVLHLRHKEEILKVLGFGGVAELCAWERPHCLLVEVAHEEVLKEEYIELMSGSLPWVALGEENTMKAVWGALCERNARTDITPLRVNQSWKEDPVEFAAKDDTQWWWKAPQKLALLGGWPLKMHSLYPYINNFDMRPQDNGYIEYLYLLEAMKAPERPQTALGQQSRILLRPHPDRTTVSALELAATISGAQDYWTVSVVIHNDPPDGYADVAGNAYETALATRDRTRWGILTLYHGDCLRTKSWGLQDEAGKEKSAKRMKELKEEAKLNAPRSESTESTPAPVVTAPRVEKTKKGKGPVPPSLPQEPELEGGQGAGEEEEEEISEIEEIGEDPEERAARKAAQKADLLSRRQAEMGMSSGSAEGTRRSARALDHPDRLGVAKPAPQPKGRKRPPKPVPEPTARATHATHAASSSSRADLGTRAKTGFCFLPKSREIKLI